MRFLVIGDSCTDIFRYGKVNRIAPEAPVPIIVPEKETSNPGMAGNVVKNLEALGHKVDFITNINEIKKIRYVCSKYNHLLLRVDENDNCQPITQKVLDKIKWEQYDAVVISDYCKGFLDENDIEFISKQHPLTFLDSKKLLGKWAYDISFIKINYHEYENNINILSNDPLLTSKTIITKGHLGCQFQNKRYPTQEVSVKDVSGAGDTFLAGLVVEYTRSKNIKSAIDFAQECTTIVIQKIGVSTI
jgi:D-beta-D-heptose 7-phosphate kinase/D-beta-D-heptose 1-phosphate adenosyltransferase